MPARNPSSCRCQAEGGHPVWSNPDILSDGFPQSGGDADMPRGHSGSGSSSIKAGAAALGRLIPSVGVRAHRVRSTRLAWGASCLATGRTGTTIPATGRKPSGGE